MEQVYFHPGDKSYWIDVFVSVNGTYYLAGHVSDDATSLVINDSGLPAGDTQRVFVELRGIKLLKSPEAIKPEHSESKTT